jgi:hypothetical protein
MAKVIVGIHGLANKPAKDILAGWWQRSIEDGLRHVGSPVASFAYQAVHWADLLYKHPLHDDALYNEEPYRPPPRLEAYGDGWVDVAAAGSTVGGMIDGLKNYVGLDAVADALFAKKLEDLAFYHDKDRMIADGHRELGQLRRSARSGRGGYPSGR